MAMQLYKKGQGYWTRTMSAVGLGLLVLMGAAWIWDTLDGIRIGEIEPVYVGATGASLFVAFFGILGYYLIGRKPRVVDFMIDTEGEMKKVNWSTRREIIGSTWVVIGLTVFIALIIFVLDYLVFSNFFKWINVLDT